MLVLDIFISILIVLACKEYFQDRVGSCCKRSLGLNGFEP